MNHRRLGNSGLLVTDIALGTMLFNEQGARGTPEEESIEMVHRYLDYGGNHIDTANVYASGASEEVIGKALQGGKRQNVILATKVRFNGGLGHNSEGLSRQSIAQNVEASLRRLQTDVIDLYYAHCWDPFTPLDETLRAFDDLISAGKVRYIGVSNFKAWQVMKALNLSDSHGWSRFVAAQYQYSLIERHIEYEFMDLFQQEGIGIVPWGPLGGGFLSGKYKRGERPTAGRISTTPDHDEEAWERRNHDRNWQVIDAVGQVAEARSVTYTQVALAWLRANPLVSSVIIGARTLQQFEDNMAAASVNLTPEEMALLSAAAPPPEMYPYRMIDLYGSRQLPF